MKRFFVVVIFFVVIGAAAALFFSQRDEPASGTDRVRVVASFYPLAYFAEQIGGERVVVTNMLPPGVSPHEYEATPQSVVAAREAAIYIYNGAGFDPYAEQIAEDLDNQVIETTAQLMLYPSEEADEDHEHEEEHEEAEEGHAGEAAEEAHAHGEFDPHVWLDLTNAIREAELIRDALIAEDPSGAEVYRANAARLIQSLDDLDARYTAELVNCEQEEVIVAHDAFGYLGRRYSISFVPISGLSPEQVPTPARLAELTDLAREHGIDYIFFETTVSPKLAETLAAEVGAETLVLDPLENLNEAQQAAGEDFISIMETNLSNLQKAMSCR